MHVFPMVWASAQRGVWGVAAAALLLAGLAVPGVLAAPPAAAAATGAEGPPRVLLIHSYHRGYHWTDDQDHGIREALAATRSDIEPDALYLDWKRHPGATTLDAMEAVVRARFADGPPGVIITTDDAALSFGLRLRQRLFGPAPLVFGGVLESVARARIAGEPAVTGLFEPKDIAGTVAMALQARPGARRLHFIGDRTQSARGLEHEVAGTLARMGSPLALEVLPDLPVGELAERMAALPGDGIALFGSYSIDGAGLPQAPERFASRLSERSAVPIFALQDMLLGHGVVGGSLLSALDHGREVGTLAAALLAGTPVEALPPRSGSAIVRAMDQRAAERHGIDIERIPGLERVVGRPFSFLETYRTLVLSVGGVILVLVLLSARLAMVVRLQRRTRAELQAANSDLLGSRKRLQESIAELTHSRERLDRLAHFDPLTGLPNRLHLAEHVDGLLARDKAAGQTRALALLFLDMDNFKVINDSFGHKAGDALLVAFGTRLRQALPGAYVSRLGGDEFVLVVPDAQGTAIAEATATLHRAFQAPFVVEGQNVVMSGSIGVARYPWDGCCFDELLQNADTAMYRSKEDGPGRVSRFEPEMNRTIVERVRLMTRLREALADQAFTVQFQPQVAAGDGAVLGFEALVRWTDAELGPVSPVRFIPACEDSGLIVPLGLWVLEQACRRGVALIADGHPDVTMSVNVSVVQLGQPDFVDRVLEVLERTGLPPANLELEITESLLMGCFDAAVATLNALRRPGIRIALDDFGTGYSSLTYLRRLPINTVKLDRAFVADVDRTPEARAMVATITRLAADLGLSVVAEGVEEPRQWAVLARIGCDVIQGYLVSRPLNGDALPAFLSEWAERRPSLPAETADRVIDLPNRPGRVLPQG